MANLTTKEKDLKYIMHTYGRYDVALKSAKGVTAYDENGKKYIVCTAHAPSQSDMMEDHRKIYDNYCI